MRFPVSNFTSDFSALDRLCIDRIVLYHLFFFWLFNHYCQVPFSAGYVHIHYIPFFNINNQHASGSAVLGRYVLAMTSRGMQELFVRSQPLCVLCFFAVPAVS